MMEMGAFIMATAKHHDGEKGNFPTFLPLVLGQVDSNYRNPTPNCSQTYLIFPCTSLPLTLSLSCYF